MPNDKPPTIEAQVKKMALAGMTVREIADKLVIVKQMSERQIRNLMKKEGPQNGD